MELSFPGGSGRWGMRRGSFRQGGLPHDLVVLSDLSRALRDEERQAWQRLIRVLGHELNNSLAPIQSVAQSLESGLARTANVPELQTASAASILEDMRHGSGNHPVSHGSAGPVHGRLCAARAASAADARARKCDGVDHPRGQARSTSKSSIGEGARRWLFPRTRTNLNSS